MSLLPQSIKISAKTIGLDLVSDLPMGGLTHEMIQERYQEIRRRKINILMGKNKWSDFGDLPYEDQMLVGMPLTYMDYLYTTTPPQNPNINSNTI